MALWSDRSDDALNFPGDTLKHEGRKGRAELESKKAKKQQQDHQQEFYQQNTYQKKEQVQ